VVPLCRPQCRPWRLHKKLAGTDFRIAAVSVDGERSILTRKKSTPSQIIAFANDWTHSSISGTTQWRIRKAYDIFGVPESYLKSIATA